METSLHRELKQLYAESPDDVEVSVQGFRIDAIAQGELIEIQHGGLAAIRDKVQRLLKTHQVRVVKPIVARKLLVKRKSRRGKVVERRMSPKRGCLLDLFHDLIHFTHVFPHPRLTLEVLLVEVEEWRFPGHGRRRRWSRRDFQVEDQKLISVQPHPLFQKPADLAKLVPTNVPLPFDTQVLAQSLKIKRREAQKLAYCLRHTGAIVQAGKRGNSLLYKWPPAKRRTA